MVKIVLHGERPTSWNQWWSGKHWSLRSAEKTRVKLLVREHIDPNTAKIFDVPVHLTIIAYFDKKPQDASNICLKPYEDALIDWFLHDDSPEWVKAVTSISDVDKENPRVEIIIDKCQLR